MGSLDRLKAISNEFIADLKDNIPEGLFDDLSVEDPIKPEPSTSTKPDPARDASAAKLLGVRLNPRKRLRHQPRKSKVINFRVLDCYNNFKPCLSNLGRTSINLSSFQLGVSGVDHPDLIFQQAMTILEDNSVIESCRQ
ncbi:hypothetical protein PGTUg99_000130 [Puccinia graminis f. sp. tritici]|uniref:Uncharacterized protein n=1 Tax=Puccinia graminis f. sp. tritici TaxID=56615 RepID=A0A5B0QYD7_PUCGR|nr:hypothetical protein PGTUg99_000130 [Puccinia graminis f. sp. tritici]